MTGEEDGDRFHAECWAAVGDFVAALLGGRRREWIEGFFLSGYPQDISDADVIGDIVSQFEMSSASRCGSVSGAGVFWFR